MNASKIVYKLVRQIPAGKVATYGQLAALADTGPRAIGQILHKNSDPQNIPCHRVIHANGTLAAGYAFGGEGVQKSLLAKEGISFEKGKINLNKFGWTP